jgi:ABC-type branched-subunit amino acid transport system substrate-binding protein
MALLLFTAGCQPKRPPEGPPPEAEVTAETGLEQALQYERLGELERAFEAYAEFIRDNPRDGKAPRVLHRMAGIRYGDRRFEEALSLYERIQRDYPAYPDRARVGAEMLTTLYRMEDLDACRSRGEAWLSEHPGHPLSGDVLFLLGRCEADAERPVRAFERWMEAARPLADDPGELRSLDTAVRGLIEAASLPQLEAMAEQREANPYLPDILHRISVLHEEEGRLDEARQAALDLLDVTSSPEWQLEARKVLARIDEELSVSRGRIGCLLPLSGPYAIYGRETLNGIQMGAANWLSGPGEPEIELIIRDTAGEEGKAVEEVEDLVRRERVMALIGPLSSKVAEAAATRAQELEVPIITLAQKESIPQIGDSVFRNFLTPAMEVEALADHAFYDQGVRRFGILYPDNPYGRYFMNLFWDRVEELGGTVTAVEAYPPEKTDFADEVKKMVGLHYPRPPSVVRMLERQRAASGATEPPDEPEPIVDFEAVFIPDNSERVALVVPQLPFHRVLDVQLLGTSLWQSEALIELAGDYVQQAVLTSGFFPAGEAEPTASFVQQYRSAFGKEPGLLAAIGYDTVRYLKRVLENARVTTRNELRRALSESDGLPGVTGEIRFDAGGEVMKRPLLLTVKRDRFVPVDEAGR